MSLREQLNLRKLLQTTKRAIPVPVKQALQKAYTFAVPCHLGPPVAQMYVNDGQTRSFLAANNFYSTLLSRIETSARVEISFLDSRGEVVLREQRPVMHFGSCNLDIQTLFRDRGVRSDRGVVLVRMIPDARRRREYHDMGKISAQFYMFYENTETGSVSHIHPTSVADPANQAGGAFVSHQTLNTRGLREVVLYQCNPARARHRLNHQLINPATREVVQSKPCELAPLGCEKTVFRMSEIENLPPELALQIDDLPSTNSKPMLCRVYQSGAFSMSHS